MYVILISAVTTFVQFYRGIWEVSHMRSIFVRYYLHISYLNNSLNSWLLEFVLAEFKKGKIQFRIVSWNKKYSKFRLNRTENMQN